MRKRPLGNTGMAVSEIAFGGVEIGKPYGIGVKNTDDMLTETEAIDLLHRAVDHGINIFDTARNYGKSESIMGEAFKGIRDKVILETKCNNIYNEDGEIPKYPELQQIIETSLNDSLQALQTDYVDIFMLHQSDLKILENEDVSRVFLNLKRI